MDFGGWVVGLLVVERDLVKIGWNRLGSSSSL